MNNAKPRSKSTELAEKHIQQTCTEWLELDGWRALRTDPVSRREWGKGFGEVGMADHLYIRYGPGILPETDLHGKTFRMIGGCAQVLWIEYKRLNRGGKPTKAANKQRDWHKAERARGALTLIAGEDFPATIEGFMSFYRQSGLMRRNLR